MREAADQLNERPGLKVLLTKDLQTGFVHGVIGAFFSLTEDVSCLGKELACWSVDSPYSTGSRRAGSGLTFDRRQCDVSDLAPFHLYVWVR